MHTGETTSLVFVLPTVLGAWSRKRYVGILSKDGLMDGARGSEGSVVTKDKPRTNHSRGNVKAAVAGKWPAGSGPLNSPRAHHPHLSLPTHRILDVGA